MVVVVARVRKDFWKSSRIFGDQRALVTSILCVLAVVFAVKYCSTTKSPLRSDNNKLILVWVPFFGDPYFGFGNGSPAAFREAGCNYSDCRFVENHRWLPIEQYDALLFHGFEYYDMIFGFPARRTQKQIYIFMSLEAAVRCPIPDSYRDFYNYTMTYRIDSDVKWPYFEIEDLKTGQQIAPALNPPWESYAGELSEKTKALINEKERDVAWFVSNCNSKSGRERLARELNDAGMHVDIYGKCGNLKCPVGEWDKCMHQLRKYRFYLAFENSLCKDYVTEKSVTALLGGAVPVVFSGANLTRFLPPGSYVEVTGEGVSLARVLRELSSPEEYAKLHAWRGKYRVVRRGPGFTWPPGRHPFCELCARLHQGETVTNIQDVYQWWHYNNKGEPICDR